MAIESAFFAAPTGHGLTRDGGGPYGMGPHALVAELVDALVSGTSGESRGGSSPLQGTIAALCFGCALGAAADPILAHSRMNVSAFPALSS